MQSMTYRDYLDLLVTDAAAWNRLAKTTAKRPPVIDLREASLSGLNLSRRDFARVNFTGADLRRANLYGTRFTNTNLHNADLRNAYLMNTVFLRSDLSAADFSHTMLEAVTFDRDCNLEKAQFVCAALADVVVRRSRIKNANFSLASAWNCIWAEIDLSGAKNLHKIRHIRPSTLGLDTIVLSEGRIPLAFLRGCGVPAELTAFAQRLARHTSSIQFFSCFISYSSADDEFCRYLHADLQAAGVPCWFAPVSVTPGDQLRDVIESAIRRHEKVVLVLSKASIHSAWVRSEVEAALDRERRKRQSVLVPIQLDDAVSDAKQAWAATVRRERHIGDFSGWKNKKHYKRELDRLLRTLQRRPNAM